MAEAWAQAALAERRRERDALIAKAQGFVDELSGSDDLMAAVVYGSVARGDFNAWSDLDLLLIMRRLPAGVPERLAAIMDRVPPGVQVVLWTPDELARAHRAGNPIAREAVAAGVVLHGAEVVRALRDAT